MLRSVGRLLCKKIINKPIKPAQKIAKHFSIFQEISPSVSSTRLLKKEDEYYCCRFKKKQAKSSEKSDSESESNADEDFLDNIQDKNTKVLKIGVTSLRIDAILKASLGMARNKIETLFYESKLKVNGEKVLKKSSSIKEGDEIDIIKGPDIKNPNFTVVSRVEILSITPKEESISVKVRRCKSLSVEDYTK